MMVMDTIKQEEVMAKERLVVNGYPVPTGYSGVAVRAACELIMAKPGVTQKELLEHAVKVSGLNLSTAGWITSPGPKSPATLLWDRRKEGVFKCYPNAFTDKVLGAQEALLEELTHITMTTCKKSNHVPQVGELVEISTSPGWPFCQGIILGFSLTDRSETSSCSQAPSAALSPTPSDVLAARPLVKCYDRVEVVLMESGSGRRRTATLGWHYKPL